jgi:two-component system cell cycle sensor histidine kinase/response regulator CckA
MPQLILVVEDEPVLAGLISRMLRDMGYASENVATARQAMGLLEDGALRPDLFVLDVRLPDMSGLQLAQRVARLLPAVPALFISGHPETQVRMASEPGAAFLPKPFSSYELAAAVRQLLAKPRTS